MEAALLGALLRGGNSLTRLDLSSCSLAPDLALEPAEREGEWWVPAGPAEPAGPAGGGVGAAGGAGEGGAPGGRGGGGAERFGAGFALVLGGLSYAAAVAEAAAEAAAGPAAKAAAKAAVEPAVAPAVAPAAGGEQLPETPAADSPAAVADASDVITGDSGAGGGRVKTPRRLPPLPPPPADAPTALVPCPPHAPHAPAAAGATEQRPLALVLALARPEQGVPFPAQAVPFPAQVVSFPASAGAALTALDLSGNCLRPAHASALAVLLAAQQQPRPLAGGAEAEGVGEGVGTGEGAREAAGCGGWAMSRRAACPAFPALTALDLSSNQLCGRGPLDKGALGGPAAADLRGVRALCGALAGANASLTALNLSANALGPEGVAVVCASGLLNAGANVDANADANVNVGRVRQPVPLASFDARANHVGLEGAVALFKALQQGVQQGVQQGQQGVTTHATASEHATGGGGEGGGGGGGGGGLGGAGGAGGGRGGTGAAPPRRCHPHLTHVMGVPVGEICGGTAVHIRLSSEQGSAGAGSQGGADSDGGGGQSGSGGQDGSGGAGKAAAAGATDEEGEDAEGAAGSKGDEDAEDAEAEVEARAGATRLQVGGVCFLRAVVKTFGLLDSSPADIASGGQPATPPAPNPAPEGGAGGGGFSFASLVEDEDDTDAEEAGVAEFVPFPAKQQCIRSIDVRGCRGGGEQITLLQALCDDFGITLIQ
jgi:hypothetical protein